MSGIARGASAVCAQKLDLWESLFLERTGVECLWTESSLCEKHCVWWSCMQWLCNRMWRMWAWPWQPWPEVKHIHEGYGLLMTLSLTWKSINWRSKESSFSWTIWLAWISWRSTQEEDWQSLSCAASSSPQWCCQSWITSSELISNLKVEQLEKQEFFVNNNMVGGWINQSSTGWDNWHLLNWPLLLGMLSHMTAPTWYVL